MANYRQSGSLETDSKSVPTLHSGFFNKATEDSMFSNVIDLLFNCTCFIYIGMVIPFSEWSNVHTSVSRESGVYCQFACDACCSFARGFFFVRSRSGGCSAWPSPSSSSVDSPLCSRFTNGFRISVPLGKRPLPVGLDPWGSEPSSSPHWQRPSCRNLRKSPLDRQRSCRPRFSRSFISWS